MVLGRRETTGRLSHLDRDNRAIHKNIELSIPSAFGLPFWVAGGISFLPIGSDNIIICGTGSTVGTREFPRRTSFPETYSKAALCSSSTLLSPYTPADTIKAARRKPSMSGHSLLSNSVEFLLTSYRSRSWEARLKHQILEEHQELNYLHATSQRHSSEEKTAVIEDERKLAHMSCEGLEWAFLINDVTIGINLKESRESSHASTQTMRCTDWMGLQKEEECLDLGLAFLKMAGKLKERAEKDGAQDLTITYACARMRYGRGRCVIGTLSVVDRARVLLPLIRKKCHDALLWQLKWNFTSTSRGCDVWCGEPQDSSFVVRAKYWHAAIGRLMKSQRLNWKKSDTLIRVWHELAGDSVTAHRLVRTLDENEVARMLFRKGRSKGRRTL
ncbi:hypothetical protein ACFE04_019682 [Oxalis oulophora]